MTEPSDRSVRNEVNGLVTGPVVQIGVYHAQSAEAVVADRLREAVHEVVAAPPGAGFRIAPGLVLMAGSSSFVIREAESGTGLYPCLSEVRRTGDQLAVFSHQDGWRTVSWAAPGGLPVAFHGAPVINWGTGAVCGVLWCEARTARVIPASVVLSEFPELARWHGEDTVNRAWLDLLDDAQLRAGGWRYPGPELRRYLSAASRADGDHPYVHLLRDAPPLEKVYLRQHASRRDLPLVEADAVLDHRNARVIGDPGAGKSSLMLHLTAESARRWLREGRGEFIPIPVSAKALTNFAGLPDVLASGVVRQLDLDIGEDRLKRMLDAPIPGVPWLVLVDGMDEIVHPEDRRKAFRRVENHRTSPDYRFLVTTRPLAYLPETDDPTFTIEPFNRDQRRDFSVGWFRALGNPDPDATADEFLERVRRTKLDEIAGIPLICTMLCVLFAASPCVELPDNQTELYGSFVSWLMGKMHQDIRGRLRPRAAPYGPAAEEAVDRLLDHLDGLIEDLAYDRQELGDAGYGSVQDWIHNRSGVLPPGAMPAEEWTDLVMEVLRASGLLVQRRKDLRFVHQTVEEYFAARRLARTGKVRVELKPRGEWPWPRLGVYVFLATYSDVDLGRTLKRLVKRRHREHNVGFVVELVRHGATLDPRITAVAADALRGLLADIATSNWRLPEYAGWLADLDPDRTVIVLAELSGSAKVTEPNRFKLVEILTQLDWARGMLAMERLSEDRRLDRRTRMSAAERILRQDPERGVTVLARLAGKGELAEQRVRAAELVGWHDRERGLSILESLRSDASLRLPAARILAAWGRPDALVRIASAPGIKPAERIEASLALASHDQDAAITLLKRLAGERNIPGTARLQAAELLLTEIEAGGDALADLIMSGDTELRLRIEAGRVLGHRDPAMATRLLFAVTEDCAPADELDVLDAIADLAGASAVMPRYRKVAVHGTDGTIRLRAAERVGETDSVAGLKLAAKIAKDRDVGGQDRLTAAERVAGRDRETGSKLYADLCEDVRLGSRLRLQAGKAAGSRGSSALAQLSRQRGVQNDDRLEAAEASKDPSALADLSADPSVADSHRLRAIGLVDDSAQTVQLYVRLSESRSAAGRTRFEAAQAAAGINERKGKAALRKLAADRHVDRAIRRQAQDAADS